MLAISERVRPCRLRWKPSSVGRSTRTTPSSLTTRISGCTRWLSAPRGPFTVTTASSPTVTSTPLGISMGCFPILLMSGPLPHVRQDLAADPVAGRVAVRHHTVRGRDDRDAQPAEHAGQAVMARVHPPAGLADALDAGDRALALRVVLERDAEHALDPLALPLEPADVALVGEDPKDRLVHPRRGHDQVVLVRQVGVANPRQHVADRVVHVGGEPHHEALVTPGNSPAWASSRKQMRHNRNRR